VTAAEEVAATPAAEEITGDKVFLKSFSQSKRTNSSGV